MGTELKGNPTSNRGERHHCARLTNKKVRWLRRLHDRGMCVHCIALLLGMSYTTIWDAANYQTWKHVR